MTTEREVRAVASSLVAAFGRADTAAYFGHFAEDATFLFHTTPRRLGSRAEYEAEWRKWEREEGFRVLSCHSAEQEVQDLGDVAVLTHRVCTRIRTSKGEEELLERETIVFRRFADGWRAVHEHLSPDPATTLPPA